MKTLFSSCFVAVMLSASVAFAAPHGGGGGARGGGGFSGGHAMPGRGGGHPFVANGAGRFNGQHFQHGGNWGGNWHHHHHHDNDFIFVGDFGFPFWGWGWGYPYYPYGYYPYPYYGYPYGYYGSGYYGGAAYGGYGNAYGSRSNVAALQRRLARAGYYHGSIDGRMGPRTREAMRAYQRNHHSGAYG